MANTCATCKHYSMDKDDFTQGMCRRFPPTCQFIMSRDGPVTMAQFPPVEKDQSCGEHTPRLMSIQ